MDTSDLWRFLPLGYLLSVLLEMPVLLIGLSPRHSWKRKICASLWLTACTYPIVILVLPLLIEERLGRAAYLTIAETFAPLAECGLFWLSLPPPKGSVPAPRGSGGLTRDFLTIIAANLFSFLGGGLLLEYVRPQMV